MMPYGELSVNAHAFFGSYALLLTTAAIYLLVNTFALHFSLQSRASSVCLALGCVFVLMGMGDTLIDAPAMSKTAGCIVRLSAAELALVLLMLTVLAVIFYIFFKKPQKGYDYKGVNKRESGRLAGRCVLLQRKRYASAC